MVVLLITIMSGCAGTPKKRPVVLYSQPVPTTCIGGYDYVACSNGKNLSGAAYGNPNLYFVPNP